MNERGLSPDLNSWLAFLRLFESEAVKRYILHAMGAKGLLDTRSAVRRAAKEMVPHDVDRAVQMNMGLASLLGRAEGALWRWLA